jgi:hypothetical protein
LNKYETVILCDRAAQVAVACAKHPTATIVALTADVAWTCQCRSAHYLTLDDFTSDAALNDFGDQVLKREYQWAAWLDEKLQEVIPDFARMHFNIARSHLYWLKRNTDFFLLPARCLLEFERTARPERVIAFEREAFVPGFETLAPGRPIHSLIAPAILKKTVVDVVPTPAHTDGLTTIDKSPSIVRRATRALLRRTMQVVSDLGAMHKPVLAWVGDASYGMGSLTRLLQARGYRTVRPPRRLVTNAAERTRIRELLVRERSALFENSSFWSVFDAVSPELRPFARPFLENWLTNRVPRAWEEFLAARAWLERCEAQAMFGVEVQDPATAVLYAAAGSLGLPRTAIIHHGGMIQDLPVHDSHGPIQADNYLVNGDGDVDYFTRLAVRLDVFPHAQVIATGSARLDDLARFEEDQSLREQLRDRDSRPMVLYVPTMLSGCYRYFGEGHISDVRYFQLQQRILSACARFDDVRILYKPYNSGFEPDPMLPFIQSHIPNATVVHGYLPALMHAADAVVIDFSATAITEAVAIDRPLLIYAGRDWARMTAQAKLSLHERATIATTPEEFELAVERFLAKRDFAPPSQPAADFARLYMTHLGDGRSAHRMADVIVDSAKRTTVITPNGPKWDYARN